MAAAAALLAVGLGLAPAPLGAAGSCGVTRGETGRFDFYLLSLSWSPAYCARAGAKAEPEQCGLARGPRGFVVHGLWPQYRDGTWPQCCAAQAPFRPEAVPGRLDGAMIGTALRRHEWEKHGACATPDPAAYFTEIARAVERYGLAGGLGVPESGKIRVSDLKRHWQLPAESIVPICRGRQLAEVRLCLGRDLAPLPCPPSVKDDDRCPGTVGLDPPG